MDNRLKFLYLFMFDKLKLNLLSVEPIRGDKVEFSIFRKIPV